MITNKNSTVDGIGKLFEESLIAYKQCQNPSVEEREVQAQPVATFPTFSSASTSFAGEPEKQLAQPANKRPRREVEKQNAQFCKGIETVLQVTDRVKLAEVRKKVQEMCEWGIGGFPGNSLVPCFGSFLFENNPPPPHHQIFKSFFQLVGFKMKSFPIT